MTSPLLALFSRSLREDVRNKWTFWARSGAPSILLVVVSVFAVSNDWRGAQGLEFFASVMILQMVAITMLGLSYFASAIAEEKEEQTLGLLRMTDLNPLSILLGKSTSRLCGALLLLLTQFPFTLFAVTLGGVSFRQIITCYCTVAAYMFLLCNVALLGSVVCRNTTRAAAFTVAILSILLGAGPLVKDIASHLPPSRFSAVLWWTGDQWGHAMPVQRLSEALGTRFSGSPVGLQVIVNLLLGIGFFLVAWAVFERFCDRASSDAASPGAARVPGMRWRWRPRPTHNPVRWKDYHYLCGGRKGMIMRVLFYGGSLLAAVVYAAIFPSGRFGFSEMEMYSFLIVPFVYSIDIAAMAIRMFRTELNDQTLSALAVLPRPMKQVAREKAWACLTAALPGGVSVVLGTMVLLFGVSTMERSVIIVFGVGSWFGMYLLVHVAAWCSLFMKRGALPLSYMLTHLFRVLVFYICIAIAEKGMRYTGDQMAYCCAGINCALTLVVALILRGKITPKLESLAGEE